LELQLLIITPKKSGLLNNKIVIMKKIIVGCLLLVSSVLFITGCRKETKWTADVSTVNQNQAFLKFNFTSTYASNPSVQLEVNKTRLSNLITARTPFPGGGYNTNGSNYGDYLSVPAGVNEVSVSIPKKGTNVDSIVLVTKNVTLDAGKYYTLHITDTAANIKTVLLQDNLADAARGIAAYKFVNLMPNVPFVDLYYGTTLMAASIPYLGVSNVFTLPAPTSTATAWTIREPGSSTVLATYASTNTQISERLYTIFAMGYKGATDATRKPYVSFLLNR
jgi:hypothetical protein